MRIQVASPCVESIQTGNVGTAAQWAAIFESLGHDVVLSDCETVGHADLLVTLHGDKSHDAIVSFRQQRSDGHIILALTGTDIYPSLSKLTEESIKLSDVLVVLQEKALGQLPAEARSRTRTIIQSAERSTLDPRPVKEFDPFVVCVAGHLRDVKDPMRTAEASRLLPETSKIRIEHAGGILEPKYEEAVEREQKMNPRYHYLGEITTPELRRLMSHSQATVVSSLAEGGARVIGESIVEGTPILGTRIDGVAGLVGDDYSGLFAVGDTQALTSLLWKLEKDTVFRKRLNEETHRLAPKFEPALERMAWQSLIAELTTP